MNIVTRVWEQILSIMSNHNHESPVVTNGKDGGPTEPLSIRILGHIIILLYENIADVANL